MAYVTAVLACILEARGVSYEDVADPLESAFRRAGGMPQRFRSAAECAGVAGSLQTDARRIELPETLPYLAGWWTAGCVTLTGVEFSPRARWFGSNADATLVLRDVAAPGSIVVGMIGRRIPDVVDVPALATCGETILGARAQDGHLTLRTTNGTTRLERATTALRELEERMRADARRSMELDHRAREDAFA